MRHSKSLGNLATWSIKLRSSGSKGSLTGDGAAAAVDDRVYPTTADEYELLEDCGRGVSAVVWQARCKVYGDLVAVKALNLEMLSSPLDDIMHEAQTMKAYKHETILPLYCSFVTGEELWMVMPYMEGGSVAHIMQYKYSDGLSEVVIATIMKVALRALAYVHSHGAIHRDVKAGNVLVDAEGHVRLGDFGVAATLEREGDWGGGSSRKRLTFVGTPCWMAPEVLEQSSGYGYAADIWSFGITMLELAHGHAPFSKLPPMKVLLTTLQGPPPTLEAECGGRHFSRGMREVVARCLNKDPTKRPSARELLDHRFFKQARDSEFVKKTLLAGLPPLPQRCHEIRAGKAGTAASVADRAAMASHISYITDVAQWDFSCTEGPDSRAAAAAIKGPDSQAGSSDNLRGPDSPGSNRSGNRQQQQQQAGSPLKQQQQRQLGESRGRELVAAAAAAAAAANGHIGQQQSAFAGGGAPALPSPAAAASAAASDLALCFSGGEQIASFPISGPNTPDQSPTNSRPTTPDRCAAAAAAGDGLCRPSTAGSTLSTKKHGRFTIREGLEAYQGPENDVNDNLGSKSVSIAELARQRSTSAPGLLAPAAAAADQVGQGTAAAAGSSAKQQQQHEPHHGLVCRLTHLLDRPHSPAQQQQQQQDHHQSTSKLADQPDNANSYTPAAAANPPAAAALPSLGRSGPSLKEIYPSSYSSSNPPGSSSPSKVHGGLLRTSLRSSSPRGVKSELHSAWGHVKEACAEAVAHVAHSLHHSCGNSSSSPHRHKSPVLQQQQQQRLLQRQNSGEGIPATAAACDSSSRGAVPAANGQAGSSSSSSNNKPPKYQPRSPQQQQQQQVLKPPSSPSKIGPVDTAVASAATDSSAGSSSSSSSDQLCQAPSQQQQQQRSEQLAETLGAPSTAGLAAHPAAAAAAARRVRFDAASSNQPLANIPVHLSSVGDHPAVDISAAAAPAPAAAAGGVLEEQYHAADAASVNALRFAMHATADRHQHGYLIQQQQQAPEILDTAAAATAAAISAVLPATEAAAAGRTPSAAAAELASDPAAVAAALGAQQQTAAAAVAAAAAAAAAVHGSPAKRSLREDTTHSVDQQQQQQQQQQQHQVTGLSPRNTDSAHDLITAKQQQQQQAQRQHSGSLSDSSDGQGSVTRRQRGRFTIIES